MSQLMVNARRLAKILFDDNKHLETFGFTYVEDSEPEKLERAFVELGCEVIEVDRLRRAMTVRCADQKRT